MDDHNRPNSPSTVVIVSDSAVIDGGAAKIALETARILADAGVRVVFFAGGMRFDSDLLRGVDVRLVEKKSLRGSSRGALRALQGVWDYCVYKELRSILDSLDKKTSVVHLHSWASVLSPSVFSAVKQSGFRCVITAHDYCLGCPNSCQFDFGTNSICPERSLSFGCLTKGCDRDSPVVKLFRVLRFSMQTRLLARIKPAVVCVSEFQKSRLSHQLHFQTSGSFVVRNPIDFTVAGNENGRNGAGGYFLYVGRVEVEKGVDIFCEAARLGGYKAVVAGDGRQLDNLKAQYPEVDFKGWCNSKEIERMMDDAIALVFPSRWYEASPLTPIEAMLECGLPCIISDSCASVDDVENGNTGLYFKSGDSTSLALAMKKSIENNGVLRRNVSSVASSLACRRSQSTYLDNLLKAYSNVY